MLTLSELFLAGVAINTMLSGVTSFLTLMNSDSLQGVLSWLNGSLSGKSWYQVQTMGIYGAIGIVLALLYQRCKCIAVWR